MKNDIHISEKFQPLFQLLRGDYPEVDTVIITGGRYSLKSYTLSIFANTALAWFGWNILYTRYTNSSIIDSIKPEVFDKIELLGLTGKVHDTQTHIEHWNNRISFKGIRPGSGQQTASLKSLSGFNCFINDEAEELPDFKTFKKIFYSIRETKKRNLSILILNPTTKKHWIFKEFYEKNKLNGGENCIKGNVMYIHSSYLDCTQDQMPANILADYERMKINDPKEYENIVMGGWISELEGQVFPEDSIKRYKSLPTEVINENGTDREVLQGWVIGFGDTADEGKDNFSMPFGRVVGNYVYIFDCIFDTENLSVQESQVISKVKEHKVRKIVIETNAAGAYFKRRLETLLPGVEIYGQWSSANKMSRILSMAGIIKIYFLFPENPSPDMKRFMDQVFCILKTSKDLDDAPDSLSGMAAHLERNYGLFV